MIPGDGAVVRGLEQIQEIGCTETVGFVARGEGVVHQHGRHVLSNRVVDAPDHAFVEGNADNAGQEALGHAMRHVHTQRLAPFGNDVAFVNDDAGGVAAVLDRPDGIAKRLSPECLVMIELQIARRLGLSRDGKCDRVLQEPGVDARFRRRLLLPHSIGIVWDGGVARLRPSGGGQQEQKREQDQAMSDHEDPPTSEQERI